MAFDFDRFNTINGVLGTQLFSLLPGVGTASGLKAAAAATAAARRANARKSFNPNNIESDARQAELRAKNYRRISAGLDRAVRSVTRAHEKLLELKGILSDMRKQIVLAQSDSIDDTQRRKHAQAFDQLLGKLNSKVSSGGTTGNLIGSSIRDIFTPAGETYKTKPDSPVTETVNGVYSGSDYFITDGDGNVFFSDLYGTVLNQFPFDNTEDGELVSVSDTVDYDSSTGAISITRSGESDPFISGTLERKGLGVLHSFLYGKFTDPDLLDQALTDLDTASGKLRFNVAVIEGELTKVTAQRDFNKKLILDHDALASKVRSRATVESTTRALVDQRQQLLFNRTLQNTLSFDASGTLLSLGISNLFDLSV